jgi:hypothetical protein
VQADKQLYLLGEYQSPKGDRNLQKAHNAEDYLDKAITGT